MPVVIGLLPQRLSPITEREQYGVKKSGARMISVGEVDIWNPFNPPAWGAGASSGTSGHG